MDPTDEEEEGDALIWCLSDALFTRGAMTPKPNTLLAHRDLLLLEIKGLSH